MTHEELFTAIEAGDLKAVQSIVEADSEALRATNPDGVTPIVYAAYWGKPDIREWLLSVAPSLDFWEAVTTGFVSLVQELLGNDPKLLNAFSPDGFTALHLAAFFGHPELVRVLIEAGADATARTTNALANQPLHAAVAGPVETRLAAARLLVEAGAPVNERQSGGFTPLMAAAQNGDEELMDFLLSHRAEPSAKDDQGRSAADLATSAGHDQLAKRLETAGGPLTAW